MFQNVISWTFHLPKILCSMKMIKDQFVNTIHLVNRLLNYNGSKAVTKTKVENKEIDTADSMNPILYFGSRNHTGIKIWTWDSTVSLPSFDSIAIHIQVKISDSGQTLHLLLHRTGIPCNRIKISSSVKENSTTVLYGRIFMPPFEKGGAYCFAHVGRSVGMSVGRYVGSP